MSVCYLGEKNKQIRCVKRLLGHMKNLAFYNESACPFSLVCRNVKQKVQR